MRPPRPPLHGPGRLAAWLGTLAVVGALAGGSEVAGLTRCPPVSHPTVAAVAAVAAERTATVQAVRVVRTAKAERSTATRPARRATTRTAPRSTSTVTAARTSSVRSSTTRSAMTTVPRAWGVFTPSYPDDLSALRSIEAEAGRPLGYVMWYVHWAGPYSQPPSAQLQAIVARGSTPVITWMSDDPAATANPAYSPGAIAGGSQDAYITAWAKALKAVPGRVMLRLDHEMNGNWYPWSPGVNGTTASAYVRMWRHVHQIFDNLGVRNVTWVWSPNVCYTGSTAVASLYPGDRYVDWVGIDGYNWGGLNGNAWLQPSTLYATTLLQVQQLTTRPVMLAEVGSAPTGGDKAAWITSFFTYLKATPAVRAFVWFDADKETDWRFDDTGADVAAFAAGLTTF